VLRADLACAEQRIVWGGEVEAIWGNFRWNKADFKSCEPVLGRVACFLSLKQGALRLRATSLAPGLRSDLARQSESRLRPSLFIITGKVLPDLNRYPQRKRRSVHQSIISSLFNVEWPNGRPFSCLRLGL